MSRYWIRIMCQLAAAAVAVAGLIPAAVLLNPSRKVDKLSQLDEIYFGTNLLKSAVIALAGLAAGYLLLRVGSHLKSKRQTGPLRGN
jgi:hypothetical protein